MAASIAQLAIVIKTETAELRKGLQQVQDQLRESKRQSDEAGKGMQDSFLAAGAKIVTISKLVSILKAELRFAADAALDFQDEFVKATGGDELETFRGQWAELRRTIGASFLNEAKAGADAIKWWREQIDEFRKSIGLTPWSEFLAGMDAMKAKAEAAAKASKELDDLFRKQADNEKRIGQEAAALRDALRTPAEKLFDDFGHLELLFQRGLLDAELMGRAVAKVEQEFRDASKHAENVNKQMRATRPNVGALERGTSAEFSGRLQAQFTSQQMIQELKRLHAIQQQQLAQQRRIEEAIKAEKPLSLQQGKF